jgi:hypothetical protein
VPVFTQGDTRVLFVHVPKAGGTSVERLFGNSGFRVAYRDPKTGPQSLNRLRRCSPQHLHAEMLQQLLRLDRFDLVFMVVRDPIARFRSEYSMRRKSDLRTDSEAVDEWTDQVFRQYEDDPYVHDNHLRPQSEFLLPDAHVYRLEDGLDRMVLDLRQRHGLDLAEEIPHALNRLQRTGVSSRDVQLSTRTTQRLRDFYAEDFERFGY